MRAFVEDLFELACLAAVPDRRHGGRDARRGALDDVSFPVDQSVGGSTPAAGCGTRDTIRRIGVTASVDGPGFVHLHVHSSFSLREGALTIAKLAKLALADRMPALAITDTNNLFGALEFSEKLAREGLQPIIGLQLTVDFGDGVALGGRFDPARAGRGSVVLIGADQEGYSNLMRLASRAYLDPQPGDPPHLLLSRLSDAAGGLIALTGGPSGPIDRALALERPEAAAQRLGRLVDLFGADRLYVELQRHGLPEERAVEPVLIDLAYRVDLPLVATNEPYFATAADHEAHDALICIAEGAVLGTPDRRQLSPAHAFKTRAEMWALFADLPEACASTVEIARRCRYRPTTRKPILPNFTAPGGRPVDEVAALRAQAEEGLEARLAATGPAHGVEPEAYRRRLAFELDVIVSMKFPGYFLIVADFITWAKARGIPVGPGRGSGAGSLVAYALTITDLDPIRFGLLFERFLNPRTRLDARLRHRLLPEPARRGHCLRAGPLRSRPGRADHHLRLVPGARRPAQRRARARNAARAGRQARQAGASKPRQPGHPRPGGGE